MEEFALEGIRVVDFGWYWASPYLGMLLADMGAEVIKVESLQRLDTVRILPPYPDGQPGGLNRGGIYNMYNRNKLAITLNLAKPQGIELAKRLIAVCDVFTENYSPRVMKNFGLTYDQVRQVRPDIIYASLSAYGATGPEKDYVCYGGPQTYQSGLASVTGFPDGPPVGGEPYGDPTAGLFAAFAVLAALHHRSKTGKGQYIDLSQWETLVVLMPEAVMEYTMNRRIRPRMGNRDDIMAPHGCYRCQGERSWVSIAVGSEEEWQGLCEALGNPAWAREDRFSDAFRRWKNQDELDKLIEEWTLKHTDYEAMQILQGAGVAATPCVNNQQLVEEPHLNQRGFFVEDDHPEAGKRTIIGVPWKMSQTPGGVYRHAPLFGEHNEYVFGELLGLSSKEIATLAEEQVIY